MILLTGATGLLGNQILRALLRAGHHESILVLVRGDPRAAQARFHGLVDESLHSQFARRVEAVWADLDKPGLGLSQPAAEGLAERITHIIHAAAAVDFALPYGAARSTNLDGTVRLVELAGRARNLKAFAHISTAHVAGRRAGFIAESELEHACGFVNSYEHTKYEAELFLRERMDELPIAVYRSTTLIGEARTGTVRQFNFFHNAMRLCYHGLLPVIPGDPCGHLDLIPTDWAAEVVRFLVMENFHPGTTYHVCAEPPRSFSLQELIEATLRAFESSAHARGHAVRKPRIISLDEFDAFVQAALDDGRGRILQLLKPLGYFMPHLALPKVFGAENLHRDLDARSDLAVPHVRAYYPQVVDFCLQTRWGRA